MFLIARERGVDCSLREDEDEDDIDFPAAVEGWSKICFVSSKRRKLSTIELPEDMVYQIFLRLPVKSFIRFRCASKGVCGMIDSPVFVKKRTQHQCEGSVSSDYAVIIRDIRWFYSLNFSDDLKLANPIELDRFSSLSMLFVGCCNGIFCFWELRKQETYILWNPSNGTTKKVRCLNLPPKSYDNTVISIGYDSVNDDYKLIRSEITDDIHATSLQVYSLRKDSWNSFNGKFLPGYPFPTRAVYSLREHSRDSFDGKLPPGYPSPEYDIASYRRPGVCVSSAMHWLWKNPTDSSQLIGVFDLVTQSFQSLPLPEKPIELGMKAIELTDFRGRLCVAFLLLEDDLRAPHVWIMENYGCERSWTPLYTYTGKRKIKRGGQYTILEYSCFPNKQRRLLCNDRKKLSWWNPHKHSFKTIKVDGHPPKQFLSEGQFSYIRNLVRLDKKLI